LLPLNGNLWNRFQVGFNPMQQDVQGKVDSRAMREVNRSIVLDIIRRGGKVSRTDLAKRSALTKPTVSAIVDDLIARGIVQEVGFGKTVATGGRRARLLEFNDASAAYLGVRFGVHTTTVAIADARGEVRAVRETPTLPGDPHAAVRSALELLDGALEEAGLPRSRLASVGVTVPGMVDTRTGTVAFAPNLGWSDVPIRSLLQQAFDLPVVVHNVTNAGAIAEGRIGAAKGARSYVWVYVGHGLGAGIVIDGQLFSGTKGFSGEIGHCPIVDDGPLCSCGLRGCLETLASGKAIERIAAEAARGSEPTSLSKLQAPFDAAVVLEAARAGDVVSQRILRGVGENLGVGLSYLINVLDPELVVLGGRVMEAADYILEGARASVARHTLRGSKVEIVASTLGDRAGLMGSVIAAMDQAVRSYRIVATAERMA
jgi:N-acetylglucosamine repressor